ncbi:MAG: hypothetical protein NZ895_06550 [Archaeoglobaceae archaeon]|nr:hypothetical protein [Archaeoglobaceae archaeon]MCX8152285.1 hypothetical protein [Archaeoglobaceae archaeon]MDW8013963.1 hypothetical protein [Archaeoglobaceae archaeon]
MEFKDFVEAFKGFYKMGFAVAKTSLDMMKVAMDSYVVLYEYYIKSFVPTETYESVKKTVSIYMESQAKVFENFKKLLESFEKQQDEIISRFTELTEKTVTPKK